MTDRSVSLAASIPMEPSLGQGFHASGGLPDEIAVKRSDAIYNSHAYLTKVPVTAIEPFLEAFTKPGDLVLDMYGGSGMTGVAAAILGRRAEIRDISMLGQHIGENLLNLVDDEEFHAALSEVIDATRERLGDVYATLCGGCQERATLSRTVWSYVYECGSCCAPINFYRAFEAADWVKSAMACQTCGSAFSVRGSRRIDEVPVLDTVRCTCSDKLVDCEHSDPIVKLTDAEFPYSDAPIGEDRQMFQASALKKHGLVTTSAFFSQRNLAVLGVLHRAIGEVAPEPVRQKLLFAFTAILTRASKRYQWHPKRPLNAANQNYYIAPAFYEWNVYDLFERKANAVLRSDQYVRDRMKESGAPGDIHVNYKIGSADAIDLADESVSYVFTDPPFGSNIFYSDMNLFHEAWLGRFTDHSLEAVVDRTGNGHERRTTERYERLITSSLEEASRVLRPGGWLSLVFSNSSGEMWSLLQRSISQAGFALGEATLLSKGQRSVKGLASGFENVVTIDMVLSMRKASDRAGRDPIEPPEGSLERLVEDILCNEEAATPSHVYLHLIRHYFRRNWDVSTLHIGDVIALLIEADYDVDIASGKVVKTRAAA